MYNNYFSILLLFYSSILCKDECDRLESSRQEVMQKLSELTTHCEEVERQRDKEAENCHLVKVCSTMLSRIVIWVCAAHLLLSQCRANVTG